MTTLPISIILIFCLIKRGFTCSCVRKDADWTFGRAEFVSRVVVEKSELITGNGGLLERIYTVTHVDIYKPPECTLPTQVLTATDSATCGVRLSVGQEVVLAGTIRTSFLRIGLCAHGIISRSDAERLRTTKN
ncbi:hypothetical protein PMAYCL1PPCAC_26825 [Pristionchus mayeri]|uniref:NTR domain-containing protein n=1 Tax=Pristionchus mayeri TaxID=1317129 RepID=A0AAN5D5Z8_9BILA|nr:hypothetical protein PMAYCL1PPCAC_26825 [Pristionchus mayeri]